MPMTTTPTSGTTTTDDASAEALWRPDLLDAFEARTLPLRGPRLPHESELSATLVRRTLRADPDRDARSRAILSLPGLNDAFFQPEVASYFEGLGFTFFALDPRRSGRSVRFPAYRDYVEDLSEFFEELDAAHAELASRYGSVTLLAHSTGGLVASLWASARPGRLDALLLNSPWLGLWVTSAYSGVLDAALAVVARRGPTTRLPLPDPGNRYLRVAGINARASLGQVPVLRAPGSIPVRAGWLRAVLRGQKRLAAGLYIDAPVLVACASRSMVSARKFSERAQRSDIVLDVRQTIRRAGLLGDRVTLVRVPDGFHDLTLSVPEARERYEREVANWLAAVLPPPVA